MICDECETVAHCMKNGCVPKHQALERMAENARELGLDYEQPAQQEPVAWVDAGDLKQLKNGDVVRIIYNGETYYSPFRYCGVLEECDYEYYRKNNQFVYLEVGMATVGKIVYTKKDFTTGAVYADRGYRVEVARVLEQPAPPPECQTEAEKTAFAFGWFKALESVRQQPAQQEPYCYTYTEKGEEYFAPPTAYVPDNATPLYTSPPAQRTWVGLSPEEKKNIFLKWYGKHWAYTKQVQAVMDSVEAKLKEKNT